MQSEKKPNTLLNVFCFLLPFPVTLFLPVLIALLIDGASWAFIDNPYDKVFFLSLPIVYLVFVIVEIALALRFAKVAASPRSKAAAESFLYSVGIIGVFTIPVTVILIWGIFHR
jgi:hypothetical protein